MSYTKMAIVSFANKLSRSDYQPKSTRVGFFGAMLSLVGVAFSGHRFDPNRLVYQRILQGRITSGSLATLLIMSVFGLGYYIFMKMAAVRLQQKNGQLQLDKENNIITHNPEEGVLERKEGSEIPLSHCLYSTSKALRLYSSQEDLLAIVTGAPIPFSLGTYQSYIDLSKPRAGDLSTYLMMLESGSHAIGQPHQRLSVYVIQEGGEEGGDAVIWLNLCTSEERYRSKVDFEKLPKTGRCYNFSSCEFLTRSNQYKNSILDMAHEMRAMLLENPDVKGNFTQKKVAVFSGKSCIVAFASVLFELLRDDTLMDQENKYIQLAAFRIFEKETHLGRMPLPSSLVDYMLSSEFIGKLKSVHFGLCQNTNPIIIAV